MQPTLTQFAHSSYDLSSTFVKDPLCGLLTPCMFHCRLELHSGISVDMFPLKHRISVEWLLLLMHNY